MSPFLAVMIYYKRSLITINLINCIKFISLRVVSLKKMKTYKYSTRTHLWRQIDCSRVSFNHFSTIGRNCGTTHYIPSIRPAAIAAIGNVKFLNLFNTNFSAMWSHVLYIAFEGDVSAIHWCQFCVSLSGSLLNILQLFASFSQNPKFLQ